MTVGKIENGLERGFLKHRLNCILITGSMCLLLPLQIHRMLYLAIFSVSRPIYLYRMAGSMYLCNYHVLGSKHTAFSVHKVFNFLILLALEKVKYQKYKTQTNRKQFGANDKLFQPPPTPVLVAGRVRNFWWRFAPRFFKFFDPISDQKYVIFLYPF